MSLFSGHPRRTATIVFLVLTTFLLCMRVFAPDHFAELVRSLFTYFSSHWIAFTVLLILSVVVALIFFMVKMIAANELEKAFAQLWGFWCWTYMVRWKIRMASRRQIFTSVLGVLLIVSLYIVAEFVLVCLKVAFSENGYFPRMEVPLWLEIFGLALSLMMVRHHWQDWRLRRLDADMPDVVVKILNDLKAARDPTTGSLTSGEKGKFLEKLMSRMAEVLERDRNRAIAFSFMELQPDGSLSITYFYPPTASFSGAYTLRPDQGGAGNAYRRKNLIYIPSTEHLMALDVKTYETIGQIYVPDPPSCPYRSVLCVPVENGAGQVSVLNISSTKTSSFDLFEFGIGKMMVEMIAMLG